jgi:hypothetical protein
MRNAISFWAGRCRRLTTLAIAVLTCVVSAGCDLGLDQPANRYEQLNVETKKMLTVLRQVNDEESAVAQQATIEAIGENLRNIQKAIIKAESKDDGGGMARITNYSQATQWQQGGYSIYRQAERIREADDKAGMIVDKALEDVELPTRSGFE